MRCFAIFANDLAGSLQLVCSRFTKVEKPWKSGTPEALVLRGIGLGLFTSHCFPLLKKVEAEETRFFVPSLNGNGKVLPTKFA